MSFISFSQETYTWSGETDTEWFNGENWANGNYPQNELDSVLIPNTCPNYPSTFSQTNISLSTLTIDTEAKLILPEDNSLGLLINNPIVIKANDNKSGILFHNLENLDISYQQEFSGGLYHDVSSPIDNGLSGIFTNSVLYYFDPNNNDWVPIGSTTLPLIPGQGFFSFNEDNTLYTFEGTANNGPIVANTEFVECRGNSFIGNPYTTPIDWDMISSFNRFDIDKSIYLWDEDEANYKVWNGALGSANQGIIRPGEAFFVKVESEEAALVFTDDIKTTSYEKEVDSPEGYIEIEVEDGKYSDKTYIWWHPEATDNYDFELDAEKFFGYTYSPDIYTMGIDYNCGQDTLPYSINAIELPVTKGEPNLFTKTLYFESGDSTNYTFSFKEDSMDDYITYSFIDSLLNVQEQISNSFTYSFTCSANSLYDHRFYIKSNFNTGIAENEINTFDIYAGGNNKIYVQNDYNENFHIQLFDLLGHKIYEGEIGFGKNEISLSISHQYIVVQILTPKSSITQKVFIR